MAHSVSRSRIPLLAAFVIAAAPACSDGGTGPTRDAAAPIQTAALSYTLTPLSRIATSAEIEFVFTNRSEAPIYIPNCNGWIEVVVERETDDGWVFAASQGYPDCLSPVIDLAPGESASSSVTVVQSRDVSSFCCGFEPGTEPPGIYRVRATSAVRDATAGGPPFGDPVEERFVVSNRFRLEPFS